ncbi:MAG: ribosome biogenesis GTPase YlqF [Lachnospiraceae bacterium]|nr:ribosome biogenesis GTPase YlqF [Lachnospiraceae bacterium]
MEDNKTTINWYPGHMAKAKRQMQEDLKLIDCIVEIIDARIPLSTKNPDIDAMANGKSRVLILNKADLADESATAAWKKYFEDKGFFVCIANSKNGEGIKGVTDVIRKSCAAKIERDLKKGIKNRPIRAMIAGVPNSGKSTFINAIAGKVCAKTGNKPGVTKGKQWIRLNKEVELLDTPGILWPKFEDQKMGMRNAFIGSINDEILFPEELAYELISILKKSYPGAVEERYDISGIEENEDINEIIRLIAVKRSCIKKGAEPDTEKAAKLIIDDFRSGKLGRLTLENIPVVGYDSKKGN